MSNANIQIHHDEVMELQTHMKELTTAITHNDRQTMMRIYEELIHDNRPLCQQLADVVYAVYYDTQGRG